MPRLLACLLLFSTLCLGTAHAAEDIGPKALDAISALHKAGEYEQAAKATQALVAARTLALGAEDPETLRARMVLARITLGLGREQEADAQLRVLLPVMTRVFGAEQRETLASQSDLLAATAALGHNAEAAEQYRQFIPIAERVLGPANGITLKTRYRFAGVLFELGKREEAEKEYREALDLGLRRLSANDRTTLNTQTAKALASRLDGKHAEAAALWQHLLPLQTRLLGSEHPDSLRAKAELAEDLDARGLHEEAEQRLFAVLPLQQRVLGAMHPDTLSTCRGLAECLQAQHKTKEALSYARRALAGSLQVFGPDKPDTLLCQQLVATLTQPAQPAPKPVAPEDRPVATVDGTPILASDLQQAIDTQEQMLRYQFRSEPKRLQQEIDTLKRTALDTLIDAQVLVNEFPRIGGDLKPEIVESDISNVIKEAFKGDRAAFLAELEQDGLTLEKFRAARERMIISLMMRSRIAGKIEVQEEEVRAYYTRNKQRWSPPEEVKLHSLTIPETLHQTDAATLGHVETLRARIINGADFATLARAESKDSHADEGGAWGWTPLTDLSEDVRAAVIKTPKGAVSEIIEQTAIFIVVRVDDRRTPPPPPFEKVQEEATILLKDELAQERIQKTLTRLRAAADIKKMGPV